MMEEDISEIKSTLNENIDNYLKNRADEFNSVKEYITHNIKELKLNKEEITHIDRFCHLMVSFCMVIKMEDILNVFKIFLEGICVGVWQVEKELADNIEKCSKPAKDRK